MIPLSLQTIADVVGGRLTHPAAGSRMVQTVSTNSKAMPAGGLFIALRGENFDAHNFLVQVTWANAAAAIIHNPEAAITIPNLPCIIVDDTRKALGRLGAYARTKFAARAIAIGGSNGKTTTKHLVGSVLAAHLKGTQSPKSFNNDIGVPLTLLGVSADDDYVVLELGTNHPGELSPLSAMARPQIAAITSIGPEHLEGFGDLDGVRQEELALLDHLAPEALVIVNSDDAELPAMAAKCGGRMITFGFAANSDLRIEHVQCGLEGITFKVAGIADTFSLPLPGRHNAANALVAVAIGREMGLTDPQIREALANCSRPEMRMQVQKIGDYTILNDAYNANPASMTAALQTLSQATVPHRRLAVLGEMRELGMHSAKLHAQIGEVAAKANLCTLITVGEGAREIASSAVAAGMPQADVLWVDNASAVVNVLTPLLQRHDTILLKASRAVKLETVAIALSASAGKEVVSNH